MFLLMLLYSAVWRVFAATLPALGILHTVLKGREAPEQSQATKCKLLQAAIIITDGYNYTFDKGGLKLLLLLD